MDNNRNMILAIVLSALVLIGWSTVSERYFPAPKPFPAATKVADQATVPATVTNGVSTIPNSAAPVAKSTIRDVKAVLAEGNRITIDTPRVKGSINLKGGQIDDLVLPTYTETIAKGSPSVRLLSPAGAKDSYFAGYGWMGDGVSVPNADTLWTADRETLTPTTPITLGWDNGAGQTYKIKIAVDENYMFSVDQSITNGSAGAIGLRPYAYVNRVKGAHSGGSMLAPTQDVDSWTMHIGPIGAFGGAVNYETDYDDVDTAGTNGTRFTTKGRVARFWRDVLAGGHRPAAERQR